MRRVRLHFTLVGKSNWWERNLSKDFVSKFNNEHRFDEVRALVASQFGDRAMIIMNENKLKSNYKYPNFYSAGWFITEDEKDASELVVVEHGDTMEAATRAMLEAIKTTDWDDCSAKIGE